MRVVVRGLALAARRSRACRLVLACASAFALLAVPAAAAGASTISGRAFDDPSRTGVYQPGDPVLASQQIYLFDGSGNYLGTTLTAADGTYSFTGLADGAYTVQYANPDWWNMRDNWVPDTTGSIYPKIKVALSGSAEADFGWRAIVRSTDLSVPISEVVGPNGLRVESYDDVVSAQTIYDKIMMGTVGGEAPFTTVRFDWVSTSTTTTSVSQTNGVYSNYRAISYVAYDSWLDSGALTLSHEYGHAWGSYYAYIVQQDPTLHSYLLARALSGNASLNTSTMWSQWEILADDYRQLLGPPDARSAQQMNTDIALASQVPGLGTFLTNVFTQTPAPVNTAAPSISGTAGVGQTLTCDAGTWTQSPALAYQWNRDGSAIAGATSPTFAAMNADGGHALSCKITATDASGSASATSAPVTVAQLTVNNVAMSPSPVKTSGIAAFTLSVPASVTVQIVASSGSLVKTVISGAPEPAGTDGTTWSRPKNLKSGTYVLRVVASAGGASTSASQSFSVS
jgi:hypothetical protein